MSVVFYWRGTWVLADEYLYPPPEAAAAASPTASPSTGMYDLANDTVHAAPMRTTTNPSRNVGAGAGTDAGSNADDGDDETERNLKRSAWLSFGVGYAGFALLCLPQCLSASAGTHDQHHGDGVIGGNAADDSPAPGAGRTQRKGVLRAAVHAGRWLHTYVLGFFVVSCWRGVWLLQDIYILPNDRLHSAWVSHCVGFGALTLGCHFQSVLAPPGLLLGDYSPASVGPGGVVVRPTWPCWPTGDSQRTSTTVSRPAAIRSKAGAVVSQL